MVLHFLCQYWKSANDTVWHSRKQEAGCSVFVFITQLRCFQLLLLWRRTFFMWPFSSGLLIMITSTVFQSSPGREQGKFLTGLEMSPKPYKISWNNINSLVLRWLNVIPDTGRKHKWMWNLFLKMPNICNFLLIGSCNGLVTFSSTQEHDKHLMNQTVLPPSSEHQPFNL